MRGIAHVGAELGNAHRTDEHAYGALRGRDRGLRLSTRDGGRLGFSGRLCGMFSNGRRRPFGGERTANA